MKYSTEFFKGATLGQLVSIPKESILSLYEQTIF